MDVVAHFVRTYLDHSPTWLYNQLINFKQHKHIIITNSKQNLDIFPFSPIYSYSDLSLFGKLALKLKSGFGSAYDNYFLQVLKNNRAKLLHAHFGECAAGTIDYAKKVKIPMITTFYGYDISQLPQQQYWFDQYQRLFAEGDLFAVEGSCMRERLIELGCPPEKAIVQHLGVDVEKFPFKPRTLSDGEKVKILIAAYFKEKKGIPYAIKAFAQVYSKYPQMELRIAGHGPMQEEIESLIAELKLTSAVKMLGYLPYTTFHQEVLGCHIFLSPSVTAKDGDTEGGAPVAITEAQCTGMPVVATFHADIPEIVLDGKTGFLAPERDVDMLAEKLEYLAIHPEIWPVLGKNARLHIEREYNLYTQVERMEDIYSSVIED